MKSILFGIVAIGLLGAMIGGGLFAYFSDTETSNGNTFTAGTIDLDITGQTTITLTNMKPGDSASGDMKVANIGTLDGSLYATSWYVTADGAVNDTNMTDDEVAKMLLITAFTVDTFDILTQIPDTDADGKITIYDMVNDASGAVLPDYPSSPGQLGTWYSYDANMTATSPAESHTYAMTVQFDTAADNDYQGDGIILTFEFLLTQ